MKRLFFLLPVLFVMCQTPGSGDVKTQTENDSLQRTVSQKDSTIYAILETFNDIESNLSKIKEKEHIISNTASDLEQTESREQRINDDINMIYKLMLENKNQVIKLKRQLKRSNINSNELKNTINNLQSKLQEKDAEIVKLREDLVSMNLKIDELTYQIDTLIFDNELKDAIIKGQDSDINTAYYIIGTDSDLKEQKIIDQKGLFIGAKKVNQDFDRSLFNKIDIRDKTSFNLNAKKIKVLTTHATDSYTVYGEKPIDSLVVNSPSEFWGVSKYLVIVVR